MARVTGTVPNFFNGVSQQTPALRLPTQCAEQVNFYPSLVQGLVKRPGLEIINDNISGAACSPDGTTHLVDRGSDSGDRSRCFIYVTKQGVTAFRPDGTEKPVTVTDGARAYLASGAPGRYSILTVADHTFISNPTVKTALHPAKKSPASNNCAFVTIRQAAYETDYTITVKMKKAADNSNYTLSKTVTTWTSLGTEDNPKPKITVKAIVDRLEEALTATSLSPTQRIEKDKNGQTVNEDTGVWSVPANYERVSRPFILTTSGGVLCFRPTEGYTLTSVEVQDSEGGQLTRALHGVAVRFSDLPSECVHGTIMKITGDDTTRFNDYYVRFDADDTSAQGPTKGVWSECPAPSILTSINPSTMPHVLVDLGDRFELRACDQWEDRTCGDDETCPVPDFIGSPVTGMFQYRNRLGLLSGDLVTLSEASNYFNFWTTTAMTQVDSDPIYLSASVEGAPSLRYAIPFNEEIILFSDRAQFKLVSPETLSPATAAINTVTYYSMNNDIKPVSNGRNIFFCNTQSHTALDRSTRVYEYYLDAENGVKAAMEITSHVPQYIDSGVTDMACSTGLSLLALFRQGSNVLYMYKYYWSGSDKLQTAWFTFAFGDSKPRNILGAEFIGDVLYCLISSEGRYFLCKLDFSVTLDESRGRDAPPLALDMLQDYVFDGAYHSYENRTYVNVPEYYDRDKVRLIDLSTMREIERAGYDDMGYIILNGQFDETSQIKIGEAFPSTCVLSPALVRGSSQDGQGQLATHMGLLQLQHWRFILGPTEFLEVNVSHDDGRVFTYRRTPSAALRPGFLAGSHSARELETFEVPVRGDAKRIAVSVSNPTWFPSALISAEWDGNYITKGRQHL